MVLDELWSQKWVEGMDLRKFWRQKPQNTVMSWMEGKKGRCQIRPGKTFVSVLNS